MKTLTFVLFAIFSGYCLFNISRVSGFPAHTKFEEKCKSFRRATYTASKIFGYMMGSGGNNTKDKTIIGETILKHTQQCWKLSSNLYIDLINSNSSYAIELRNFQEFFNINEEKNNSRHHEWEIPHVFRNNNRLDRIPQSHQIWTSLTAIKNFVEPSPLNSWDFSKFLDLVSNFYKGKLHNSSIQKQLYVLSDCMSLAVLNRYLFLFSLGQRSTREGEFSKSLKSLLSSIASTADNAMRRTSQSIRRYDPAKYEEGVNFLQLKYFLHSTLLGKHHFDKSLACDAKKSCGNFMDEPSPNKLLKHEYRCNGNLYSCEDSKVNRICFPKDPKAGRKYQAFKDDSGNIIGPWNSECTGDNVDSFINVTRIQSIQSIHGITFSHMYSIYCGVCICLCDDFDHPNTTRTFNLRPVRVKDDQGAITGIKFEIENDTIVLNIRVGILVNGMIDLEQHGWNSDYVLDYDDHKNTGPPGDISDGIVSIRNDSGYVYLNDFQGPPGTLTQGVKISYHENDRNKYLSLSILATRFNDDGKLLPGTAEWYPKYENSKSEFGMRKKFEIPHHPQIPTMLKSENSIISQPNSYIKFRSTDWITDAGQTTVPFFDIQEIVTEPPVPLAGVGLYYKTQPNSGGFVGLQLLTLNYSFFLSEEIIDRDLEIFNGV